MGLNGDYAGPHLESDAVSRSRAARAVRSAAFAFLTLLVCVVTVFPIYWMIVTTLRPSLAQLALSTSIPADPNRSHRVRSTLRRGGNQALDPQLDALALIHHGDLRWPRHSWRLRAVAPPLASRTPFAILLMTQMLPEALIIVPIFAIYRTVTERGIPVRESLPLIDAAFILPINLILKNMFDSCRWKCVRRRSSMARTICVLFQIVLPLTRPGLVAVGVVAFSTHGTNTCSRRR